MSQNKVAIWKLNNSGSTQCNLTIQLATQTLAMSFLLGTKHMPQKGGKIPCKLEFSEESISVKMKNTVGDEPSSKSASNCPNQQKRNKNIKLKYCEQNHQI